jgi:purine-binding chemotaxis protein CheW
MSNAPSSLADRAEDLRRAFDRSFAEEVRRDVVQTDDFLGVRIGSEPYALRLSEIAGLYVDRAVTRLPSGAPALLGFASFRGSIAPVYDLHLLLGRASAMTPRWLVAARGSSVAFAFEMFERHLRVPRAGLVAHGDSQPSQPFIKEFASIDGLVRPIVHLPSVLDAIRGPPPRPHMREE